MSEKPKQLLQLLTGLSGVATDERAVAQRWARRFEFPMIMLANCNFKDSFVADSKMIDRGFPKMSSYQGPVALERFLISCRQSILYFVGRIHMSAVFYC